MRNSTAYLSILLSHFGFSTNISMSPRGGNSPRGSLVPSSVTLMELLPGAIPGRILHPFEEPGSLPVVSADAVVGDDLPKLSR